MTMALDVAKQAIYNGIHASGTYDRIIFYEPNAPRPALPYTSIQIIDTGKNINDWTDLDKFNNITQQKGFRELVWNIAFYGPGAIGQANQVMGAIMQQPQRDLIRQTLNCGLSILDANMILNATVLVDDKYEERAAFEMTTMINLEDGSTGYGGSYFDKVEPINWKNKPPQ